MIFRRSRPTAFIGLACAALLLGGCAASEEEEYVEQPVELLYNQAIDALENNETAEAQRLFDEVDRQHPYSTWATKAQMMTAYAAYLRREYDDAIIALDRFIQLHPSHRDIAYAYYLRGLCYYEQISDVARDQQMTKEALNTLKELISRFPESKYARDAKVKIDLTYDHLAGKEMEIGRYYQNTGHYLAAINRFKAVVDEYDTTTHVPEALHRLAETYFAIGLETEAQRAAAILGHNYPGSEWYIDSYELVAGKPVRKPAEDDDAWYEFW